jgi:O-antigen ligase
VITRPHALSVFTAVVLTALLACAVVVFPPAIIAAPALVLGVVCVIYPVHGAFLLIVAGPLLLSSFPVGSLTADNVVTLIGLCLAVLAGLVNGSVPLTRWSLFPLCVALAVGLSGLVNDVPAAAAVIRFVALATLPWLAQKLLERGFPLRQAILSVLGFGAVSLLLQPITKYPNPYLVEEGIELIRYGGLFGHPNFASYALALGVIMIAASKRVTKFDLLYVALAVSAMFVAGSLSALAVLIVVSFILLFRHLRRAVVGMALGFLLFAVAGTTLTQRLNFLESGAGADTNSLSWRFAQWSEALQFVRGSEWTGIGYQQAILRTNDGLGVHNGFVQTYVELGILGIALLLIGLIATLFSARNPAVVHAAWIYILVTSITDPVFFYPSTLAVVLVVTAESYFRYQQAAIHQAAATGTAPNVVGTISSGAESGRNE